MQKDCVCALKMVGLLSWRRETSLCCMYWCTHQEVLVCSAPGELHSTHCDSVLVGATCSAFR